KLTVVNIGIYSVSPLPLADIPVAIPTRIHLSEQKTLRTSLKLSLREIDPLTLTFSPKIFAVEKNLDLVQDCKTLIIEKNMVHHSSFVDEEGISKACGCPLFPLKSHGPAPDSDQDKTDIVDEAISFFRANVFFRNFDIKSPADKLLIYLTFHINVALKRLEGCRTLTVGNKAIINLGLENVPVPGEQGFPFPELFRDYLKEIREETCGRLLSVAYRANGTPNKWWLAFAKRKFMNIVTP
ncbi:Actin-related protein 2/3 complex subunit 3, partial [Cucurbita argyrosperma subsp. argyrosperma]